MDHNAVHSYYNNQDARRIMEDLLADKSSTTQLVELKINGQAPVLAIVTPYYAEKRTADVISMEATLPVGNPAKEKV